MRGIRFILQERLVDGLDEKKGLVELELWIKNQSDVNCVPGKGLVALPLRAES